MANLLISVASPRVCGHFVLKAFFIFREQIKKNIILKTGINILRRGNFSGSVAGGATNNIVSCFNCILNNTHIIIPSVAYPGSFFILRRLPIYGSAVDGLFCTIQT